MFKDIEKIFQRMNKNIGTDSKTGCWNWLAFCAKETKGKLPYGQVGVDNKMYPSHRVMYSIFFGEIPKGLFVMHKCDNARCCNPYHLQLGTHTDNMRDKCAKGRHVSLHGDSNTQAKITEAQAKEIKYGGGKARIMAEKIGVSLSTVAMIRSNQRWSHI